MKRAIAPWTVTVTAAALLAMPAASWSQTAAQPPATTTNPQSTAQEHLGHARAALNDVAVASLSARGKTQVAELKRRLTTLERTSTGKGTAWGTEVAAMDKILTNLLGSDAAPTGTSGTTTAPPTIKGKAASTIAVDDASRAKLTEVRTALTSYAAAMSGSPAEATSSTTITPSDPAAPSATTTPSAAPKVDQEGARKHLTEARNTLSALTQLPAAAQLTGDARTQVSQLISNFNELITTQTEWRAPYAKIAANLTALLGTDPGTTEPSSVSGIPGAVGTSGSGMTIEPAVRAKLVEIRRNLADFERAATGGGSTTPPSEVTTAAPPATPPSPPATPPPPPATPPEMTTAAPTLRQPPSTEVTKSAPTAHAESMRLIAAIEGLVKMQDEGGGLTLDKTTAELLRTHLADLKKLLDQVKK